MMVAPEDGMDRRDVAEEVQEFYERYPYPAPADNLETYRRLRQDQARRRAEYHLLWPGRPYRDDHAILVAGCGTSQAAKYAMRWPAAQVTGIDVSAASVRCTEDLRRTHGLTNLQVHQLPIERAHELGTRFDQIVCTGVLHHLSNPDAGLAALGGVLAPGGAMHLMVYAPYGRTGVYMLQEFCRRLGIRANDVEIEDLMTALCALPPGHPLQQLLRDAPDFRHRAALADALLHPQDRAYSVPQVFDFISQAGLTFGRWVRQASYSPRCGVMAQIPQASRLRTLPIGEQYAAVELFRGTMVRHSVIVYRHDDADDTPRVSFEGDAWQRYVPIRMPDTVCVQERLPPGATAVLINRSHTCRDLVMALDAAEKRLFDAVDGTRSIGAIADHGAGRTFFERLWWHDQVVFDASSLPAASP
jgi:SAM-dependent methyltransferase